MTLRALAFVLLAATPTFAHLVPINPSTCALEIAFQAPVVDAIAVVAPPAAGDLIRTSYAPDANATRSRMQVCPADPVDPSGRCGTAFPPRSFTAGAIAGTIGLPSAFALRLLANGDLHGENVPVAIAVGANPPVTVPFTFGTTLVVVGTTPLRGGPLDATGAFTLNGVGTSDQLPAPFGGTPLWLQLGCTLAPPPDLDQFALAPRLTKVRGVFTTKKMKLTMVVESEVTIPADFAAVPTVVDLDQTGAPPVQEIATLVPGARGRFESDDGELQVMPLKSRTSRLMKLVLRRSVTAPTTYGTGDGEIAVSTGSLEARRTVSLKANRRGTRLAVREQ
jgi:hypothetical protein